MKEIIVEIAVIAILVFIVIMQFKILNERNKNE
jgi:hypothetical protein